MTEKARLRGMTHRVIIGVFALLLAGFAVAQSFRNSSEKGAGSLTLEDRPEMRVERVGVIYKRDGSADVTVQVNRTTYVIFGDANRQRDGRIKIRVRSGFGDGRTDGELTLEMNNADAIQRVTGSGRTSDGRWSLSFQVGRGGGLTAVSESLQGRGELTIPGDTDNVTSAFVSLDPDGEADITFGGQARGKFSGVWRAAGQNSASIEITTFDGQRVTGSGRVDLDAAGRVTSVRVDGQSRNGRFQFYFTTQADSASQPAALDQTFEGEGTMTVDGRDSRIRSASVVLKRDGTFQINVSGSRFEGTWRMGRNGERSLAILRAFNQKVNSGNGYVRLGEDGRITSIRLGGKTGRDDFLVSLVRRFGR